MGTHTVEAVGIFTSDQESEALSFAEFDYVNLSKLAEAAGADVVYTSDANAFEGHDDAALAAAVAASPVPPDVGEADWSGRVEALPEAERERVWDAMQAREDLATRAEYRERTGRALPPVYRVRIAIAVEPVDDDEAAAWWARRRAR